MTRLLRIRMISAAAIAVLTAGCATDPSKIAGVPNAGPCSKADRAQLAELSKKQRSAATSDAIGVLLIGIPVASATGGDREAEIAILKGRCG